MKFTIFFLFVFLFPSIFAGLGREVPLHDVPHNLCLLDFSNSSRTQYDGVCSGLLINSSTLVTAAHCLKRKLPQRIFCGDQLQEVSFNREGVIVHQNYETNVTVNDVAIDVFDVAIIPLKEDFPVIKQEIISFEEAQSGGDYCAFFGFSRFIGKTKLETYKEPRGWKVDLNTFKTIKEYKMLQMKGLKAPGALLQVGDSGGPLMCKIKDAWKYLGINSSRDFMTHSNFMAVSDYKLISDTHIVANNNLRTEQSRNDYKREMLRITFEDILKKINRLKLDSLIIQNKINNTRTSLDAQSSPKEIQVELKDLEYTVQTELTKIGGITLRLKPFSLVELLSSKEIMSTGDLIFNFLLVEKVSHKDGWIEGKLKTIGPSDFFSCNGEIICDSREIESVRISINDLDIYKADAHRVFK